MIVPLLADEAFLLPQLRLSAPAVPQLSWNSRSGDYQRLERSHDLLDWKKEAEILDGPEGPVSVMADEFDPSEQATFYRLVGE
jgi:hypothetical protein